MSSTDVDKLQIELDYYREILYQCDDARAHLLEYLANYYPELFDQDELKVILKQLLPFSDIADRIYRDSKSIEKNQSLKSKIESSLNYMLEEDPRKHCQILQEKDYNNLINIALEYFNLNMKVPKKIDSIKMVNTSKGNVVWTFKDLFKKVYPNKSYPDSLFNLLIKSFDQYRMDTISNLRKTKRPQYFDETINKIK